MDWTAARSYYIGYSSIDRFDSIIFFHNYYYTWSIGLICSLIIPILFLFAPSSFRIKQTSHLFVICFVCLSNMCCLFIHPYLISDSGEPNLSYHTCRFVVYISTFAKPIGIYLTFLFSIERIFTKILSNLNLTLKNYRLVVKKIYLLFIILGIISVLSVRLYETLKYVKKYPSNSTNSQIISRQNIDKDDDDSIDPDNITSVDRILSFEYCFRSMNIEIYAKILSFYVIQYWFEYTLLAIIILSFLSILIYQYVLPYIQRRSVSQLSINTKLYICLTSCVIIFELILQVLHGIVDDIEYNNSDTQLHYLETMLFIYNFRCIFLPLLICFTICEPLKTCFYELIIVHPYTDHINENDQTTPPDLSSSPQTFAKNNNNEHFDM